MAIQQILFELIMAGYTVSKGDLKVDTLYIAKKAGKILNVLKQRSRSNRWHIGAANDEGTFVSRTLPADEFFEAYFL